MKKKVAKAILLNEKDNVATALTDIESLEVVQVFSKKGVLIETLKAYEKIPFRHKIAIKSIKKDNKIIKYGEPIGKAKTSIMKGNWVHIHNLTFIE